jgi:hypothetical protein
VKGRGSTTCYQSLPREMAGNLTTWIGYMFLSSQILVLKFEACLRAARGALRILLARPKGYNCVELGSGSRLVAVSWLA